MLFRATKKPLYRKIAVETLDYIVREMRDANGGFYCAQDADSEGVEGKYYVWSLDEFSAVAGDDADLVAHYLGITEHGNFEDSNIPNVSRPPEIFCKLEKISAEDLAAKVETAKNASYTRSATNA